MYDELVKRLRETSCGAGDTLWWQAADAIEEMQKCLDAVNDAHNEGYDVGYWAGRRDYEPKWIPVTERLPEIGQRILAVGRYGKAMYTATYSGGKKETAHKKSNPYKIITGEHGWRTFTYWMPLPEPPKE